MNLPILEPYLSEEEEEPEFINSDHLASSPSYSPQGVGSMFSTITESGLEKSLGQPSGADNSNGGRKISTTSIKSLTAAPAIVVDKPEGDLLPGMFNLHHCVVLCSLLSKHVSNTN